MIYDQARGAIGSRIMDARPSATNPHCDLAHHDPTRRKFLTAASAICAAATFTTRSHAVTANGSKLIDTHHHFYPPAYQKAWANWEDQRKIPHSGVQLAWNREQDIEAMDQNAVTTSILSLASTPGTWFDAGAQAPTTWRDCAAILPPKWCGTNPGVNATRLLPRLNAWEPWHRSRQLE